MSYYEETLEQFIKESIDYEHKDLQVIDPYLISNGDISDKFLFDFYKELENRYINLKFYAVNRSQDENEQREKTVKLINWVIDWLKDWGDKNSIAHLFILLAVTCFLDDKGNFWRVLVNRKVSISEQLIKRCKQELSSLKSGVNIENNKDVPIHEKESLEKFLLAISNKKWQEMSELWRMFDNQPLLRDVHVQMLYILDYFNPNILISTFENCHDVPLLMNAMYYLRPKTAFLIGHKTQNDYLEFSSVYSILSILVRRIQFTDNENLLLSSIFNKVGNDSGKFTEWMNVFNKYPLRYPNIQIALGRMLAITPNSKNLEIYIKSISLSKHSDNESRLLVTECLKEFIKSSEVNRRKELWNIAFECWSEWNFGGSDEEHYIFEIAYSELDIAIIGYYRECFSNDERLEIKKEIVENMRSFQNRWYASLSVAKTYWYRNLSFYQVIEHADRVDEDINSWLLTGSYYIPEQFNENESHSSISFDHKN